VVVEVPDVDVEVAAAVALFAPETPTDPPQALKKTEAKTSAEAKIFMCRLIMSTPR
jgi:hypothetical protein